MIRNTLITIYIFAVLLISAIAKADVSLKDLQNLQRVVATDAGSYNEQLSNYNLKTRTGELMALANGSLILVINQKTVLPVYSSLDMSAYIGSKVMINGIEMEHQLASFNPNAKDPLSSALGEAAKIRFFVLGIQEVQ